MSRIDAQFDKRFERHPAAIPELDEAALIQAAQSYFPNGKPLSQAACAQRARQFYQTLELDQRADPWAEGDRALLRTVVPFLCRLLGRTPTSPTNRRLLIVGCGDGRLAEIYIELAVKNGFAEVIFNDLFPEHIAATRAKVTRMRGEAQQVQTSFITGNFANVVLPQPADIAIALFFVTSEVCNIQSPNELLATRQRFYRSICRNLKPGGFFVEDIPERDLPNFYTTLGLISERILRAQHVMTGVEGFLSLTHVPKPSGGEPFHIRCIPSGVLRINELRNAGLELVYSWCDQAQSLQGESLPSIEMRRIKRVDVLRQLGAHQ